MGVSWFNALSIIYGKISFWALVAGLSVQACLAVGDTTDALLRITLDQSWRGFAAKSTSLNMILRIAAQAILDQTFLSDAVGGCWIDLKSIGTLSTGKYPAGIKAAFAAVFILLGNWSAGLWIWAESISIGALCSIEIVFIGNSVLNRLQRRQAYLQNIVPESLEADLTRQLVTGKSKAIFNSKNSAKKWSQKKT